MEEMESQIREEIRKGKCQGRVALPMAGQDHSQSLVCPTGFAELQTDMTDLTKELNRSQGIPFLEYKHFVTRTFFPKVHTLPRALITTGSLAQSTFQGLVSCPQPSWFPFSPTLFLCLPDPLLSVWKAAVLPSMLTWSTLTEGAERRGQDSS